MSLLNDALRKKRAESHGLPPPNGPARPPAVASAKRGGRRWIAVAAAGGVLTGAVLFWYLRATGDPGPAPAPSLASPAALQKNSSSPMPAPVDRKPVQVASGPDRPAAADAAAPSPAAGVSEPAALPRPARAAPSAPLAAPKAPATSARRRHARHNGSKTARSGKTAPGKVHAAKADRTKAAPRIARLYDKARLFHRQGRYNEAIGLYREILKIDPKHAGARFNLISAYLQIEAFDEAYPLAIELNREQPDDPSIMLNLAIALIGRGDADRGLKLLDRVQQHPDAPMFEVYLHQGVAYRHLGRLEKAVSCYLKAERMKPGDPRLLFNLAMVRDQQQHYDQAIRYYLEFLQSSNDQDPVMRGRIEQRIRSLRADQSKPATGATGAQ
jgi:Flp pilus assembly protein TadD